MRDLFETFKTEDKIQWPPPEPAKKPRPSQMLPSIWWPVFNPKLFQELAAQIAKVQDTKPAD